jgi:hypothetical protein
MPALDDPTAQLVYPTLTTVVRRLSDSRQQLKTYKEWLDDVTTVVNALSLPEFEYLSDDFARLVEVYSADTPRFRDAYRFRVVVSMGWSDGKHQATRHSVRTCLEVIGLAILDRHRWVRLWGSPRQHHEGGNT